MNQLNESGLIPLGRAVLVEHLEAEKKGLIELPTQVSERLLMIEQKARVLAIGPEAWREELSPRATVGDNVLISKMAGAMALGRNGKQYRLVNDRDIFARLSEDV